MVAIIVWANLRLAPARPRAAAAGARHFPSLPAGRAAGQLTKQAALNLAGRVYR